MMFLNGIAMFALTAIAVPIVIHLHRRRKSKVVDWAAMQFLSQSLANRRRGLAFENLVLLLCRCLLVVLFVMAMARPQLSSTSGLGWIPLLVLGFAGLVALAWAVVTKGPVWKRMTASACALVAMTSAVFFATLGTPSFIPSNQPRDVAIVIDSSSSMKVGVDGKPNFRRACEEAQLLVDHLPGGSTVSLLLSGPVVTSPLSAQPNLNRVSEELANLEPTGGGGNIHLAMEQSRKMLAKAPNAQKQIVVFSDNQLRPWQQLASQVPQATPQDSSKPDENRNDPKSAADSTDQTIEVFCRALPLPQELNDISVTSLTISEQTVSVHRPASLVVDLLNGGSKNSSGFEVELCVNDKVVQVERVGYLESGSRTSVNFKLQFDLHGWNTVSARIRVGDHLNDNDVVHHVVFVAKELPVLIVNGDSTSSLFQRPATFLQLALDPNSIDAKANGENQDRQLTRVDAIEAADIDEVGTFSNYQVVLLCDVPRLPSDVAQRLAKFVERGGGVWILTGERCQSDFYNEWAIESTGEHLLPMTFVERMVSKPGNDKPLELDFDSVAHVTLDPLLETGQHDLSELQVFAYWKLGERSNKQAVHIGGRLTNGDPALVDHSVGQGRVLVTAFSAESGESNLISRMSFPVLAHLWVEHLANLNDIDLNHQPHRNLSVRLEEAHAQINEPLIVTAPDGKQHRVEKLEAGAGEMVKVEVGLAASPGVYRLTTQTNPDKTIVPFTVLSEQDEFDLTVASNGKLEELSTQLPVKWIASTDEIEKVAKGTIEAIELWKFFALGVMVMIPVEVLVTRWVATKRNAPLDQPTSEATEQQHFSTTKDNSRDRLVKHSVDSNRSSPSLVEAGK